ncbi:MAG: helix-turn-helix domain-containing protein [Thermoplasmata archaeon]|nr:MAG: helix-turn-helix domain-containing protein [Thermoplasmata archaeon]
MRKVIIDFYPNEMLQEDQKPMFEHFHSWELLEVLRLDYEEGVTIGVMECYTKSDIPLQDVEVPDFMEILAILKSEGNKHICVIKTEVFKEVKQKLSEYKLDLIWTSPIIFSEDKRTYSCIGDQESISKFIEVMKNYGEVKNIRLQKTAYQKHDILTVLTEKQKYILIAAMKYGYYSYPKKINSEQLSKKVNLSKATIVEHLRKAEERIMANILAGYE